MKHQNILSYIAKDIQKTCERLGIYAEFTPRDDNHIVSSDFKIQPAIFNSIHIEAYLYIHHPKVSEGDDVMYMCAKLHCKYQHWDCGENGCNLGSMIYEIRQSDYDNDLVFVDDNKRFCTIKKQGFTF